MKDIMMTIWRAATNLYTRTECENDNLVEAPFPEELVRQWYYETGFDSTQSFRMWLDYKADAYYTDSLLTFAKSKGYKLIRNFQLGDRTYTLEDLWKVYNNNIAMNDEGFTDYPFDWYCTLLDLGMKELDLTYSWTDEKEKPLTLEEMKEALRNHFKDNPDHLITRISEVVFDITDYAYCHPKFKENVPDNDSREEFQNILEWAWEFEYDLVSHDRQNEIFYDYLSSVEDFAEKKLKDYFSRTYTVVYQMTGRVEVKASSAAEARMMSGGMEIEWDDYGGEIVNVIEED